MNNEKLTQKELLDIWRKSTEPNFIKWLDKNPNILDKLNVEKDLTVTQKDDIDIE